MQPLRILMVEDVAQDAEIALRELSRAGLEFEYRRVETAEGLRRECVRFAPRKSVCFKASARSVHSWRTCRDLPSSTMSLAASPLSTAPPSGRLAFTATTSSALPVRSCPRVPQSRRLWPAMARCWRHG